MSGPVPPPPWLTVYRCRKSRPFVIFDWSVRGVTLMRSAVFQKSNHFQPNPSGEGFCTELGRNVGTRRCQNIKRIWWTQALNVIIKG